MKQSKLIFKNVSANYVAVATELLIGAFMLPFNLAYLGQASYGLWILVASITFYFSMLDGGYGVAQVRFAAKYRAEGDHHAINELASTMVCVFALVGLLTLIVATLFAFNLDTVFQLTPTQANTGRIVLLIISVYVALGFPFSVFGGIVNGLQRSYLNGTVAVATALAVAGTNILVLMAGYGLVELVIATTAVRCLSYPLYVLNAYRVFPELRIRLQYFSRARLKEVTGFSFFLLLIDLANKVNYSTDTIVIGAFMGTAAVATWAVAQRLVEMIQRITNQFNGALFPVVVDSSTIQHSRRLQNILLQGTRLSFGMVVPLATVLALLGRPVVFAWVGSNFVESVAVLYVLCIVVVLRVGFATSTVILKGAGDHRLLAISNVSIAIFNLLLSIVLVQRFGLIGVALGTLLPMLIIPAFVIFPAACRRVSLSPGTVLRESVWPAIWPAMGIILVLFTMRGIAPQGWASVIAQAMLAGSLYAALFVGLGITSEERRWYLGKAKEIFG